MPPKAPKPTQNPSKQTPKRPRTGASSSSAPVDDFFSSVEKIQAREARVENRAFGVSCYVTRAFLLQKGFSFVPILDEHNLFPFLEFHTDFYPKLVRSFYAHLRVQNGVYESMVNGFRFSFTPSDLHTLFGLSVEGEYVSSVAADAAFLTLLRPGHVWTRSHKKASSLLPQHRVLHYIINHILWPQTSSNYAHVTNEEVRLIDDILNRRPINWSELVIKRMLVTTTPTTKSWLPYPMHVTHLLAAKNVPFAPHGPSVRTKDLVLRDSTLRSANLRFHDERREYLWSDDPAFGPAAAVPDPHLSQAADRMGVDPEQLAEEEADVHGPSSSSVPPASSPYVTQAEFQSFRTEVLDILQSLKRSVEATPNHRDVEELLEFQTTRLESRLDNIDSRLARIPDEKELEAMVDGMIENQTDELESSFRELLGHPKAPGR